MAAMKPPFTRIPGISAGRGAIGKPMRAANDPEIGPALVAAVPEWEDEGASVTRLKTPLTKPPAKRP
jgi:hypothetical protein